MTVRPDFRMYVDEVGNIDMSCRHPSERYLSLSGVIFSHDYVDRVVAPELNDFKRQHFPRHVDDGPVVFHRKELREASHPFSSLRDATKRSEFDEGLFQLLSAWDYTVVTVVIDKQAHALRYGPRCAHPYHYCQEILLERYAMELARRGGTGDVMAESRGSKPDKDLETAFRGVYDTGTKFMSAADARRRLTSHSLKLKKKDQNIAGLQVCDLLAHPAMKAGLRLTTQEAAPTNFGGRVGELLVTQKWRRANGSVLGAGFKLLP